ncbi:carbohydrate ABC transporter permease [Pseudonocardia spinosispora]|uniref:carbohydrate ABC transporter permease n=1 Tax=Pseudonocardia spinosispora TaxID=103441 RepID=UPI000404D558|nr:sugar ABC transporter permease [Pseudonocardia spinosispora]
MATRENPVLARPWLWMLPLGVVLVMVFVYPILEILRLSFTDATMVAGEPYSYTAATYRSIVAGQDFADILRVTVLFVLFSVVFQLLLGFAVALLVDTAARRGLRGALVTRTVVLTAWAIPGVVIGVIWRLLYQDGPAGILNYLGGMIGLSGNASFLSDPDAALISVTVANIWRGTALSMILMYAGLQSVSRELLEAARIDGAGTFQAFRAVTWPVLLPLVAIDLITITVETFNTFDMVMALTGGGPGTATEVLALGVYDQMFNQLNLGRGATMSVVLLLINVIMVGFYFRYSARREATA